MGLISSKQSQCSCSSGLCQIGSGLLALLVAMPSLAQVLPPVEDIPEEILQTQIFTEARSPIDGKLLTAAEYAELQAQIQADAVEPKVAPKLQRLIVLLRVRKVIRSILPFLF